jgi:serine/threonine-protein kinase
MTEFWQRLKERKLVQWVLAYVAASFALLQGVDIVAQRFDWSESIERVLIIALCVGFFVTLLLAWYHGERGAQRVSGTELLLLALLLAIGGGLLWKFAVRVPAPVAGTATGSPDAAQRNQGPAGSTSIVAMPPKKSIAVLPFENLSDDKANAYFASGMQDMILTKLAAIAGLKVISRTSTEKYASHPDDLKTIARQLGVATILEGSVQKSGNQVLINVQLIDANSDEHLWADAYPRTLENIFGVEGEVAQKIADALKMRLTPAESASVASLPTRNKDAYDAFLKAEYEYLQAQAAQQQADFLAADADYEHAIALDPTFALAYARLGYCRMRRHWFATPLAEAELAGVKTVIDRALALASDLPDAHLALGYYLYWGFRRYDEAVTEFQRTLQLAPNGADALAGLAFIARRKGDWQKSLDYMDQALLVSPRDAQLRGEQGASLVYVRRYGDAERTLKLALEIDPGNAGARDQLLLTRLFGFGDVQGARDAYRPPPGWRIAANEALGGEVLNLVNPRVYPDVVDRRFADALKAWDSAPTDTAEEQLTGQVARVAIRIIAGQRDAARADCERLAPKLRSELEHQPDSLPLLQQSSWVDVCLGRNAEAIGAARRSAALMPLERDAYNYGCSALVGLAQIAAQAGDADEALQAIQRLMSVPAGGVMSVERLKLDPVWDPVRGDERFSKLLATEGAREAAQAH